MEPLTKQVKVRRAKSDDDVPWDLLLSADGPRFEVQKYIDRGEMRLAEFEDNVLGVMVLMPTRCDVLEIMNLAVLRKSQRKGVGTALLKKAKQLASQRGAHFLEVGTGNTGVGQLMFYQRFGFRIVGVDQDFFVRRWKKAWKQDGIELRDMVRLTISL